MTEDITMDWMTERMNGVGLGNLEICVPLSEQTEDSILKTKGYGQPLPMILPFPSTSEPDIEYWHEE